MGVFQRLISFFVLVTCFNFFLSASAESSKLCKPWEVDVKPRIFVATDISNEPDDTQSIIRLLLHSNLLTVEGLAAVTSIWSNYTIAPDQIRTAIHAYGEVYEHLQTHGNGQYPTADYLLSKVTNGFTHYGLDTIKSLEAGNAPSPGAQLLIAAVQSSDHPLYIQCWGGCSLVAEALWSIRNSSTSVELTTFLTKVRVYSISDQDNSAFWTRSEFPSIHWVASIHGWNQYGLAAWTGMSTPSVDIGGPDPYIASDEWIEDNIQIGPLGAIYPDIAYTMEGDSPSLLYSIPTGLSDPEHLEWGCWGGRYTSIVQGGSEFADAMDTVIGKNNESFTSNHASVWRWRDAVQSEMKARIQWTLGSGNSTSNSSVADGIVSHPPVVMVNGSCGSSVVRFSAAELTNITLDASASYDPDNRDSELTFDWFQYLEPSQRVNSDVLALNISVVEGSDGRVATVQLPSEEEACKPPEVSGKVLSERMCAI